MREFKIIRTQSKAPVHTAFICDHLCQLEAGVALRNILRDKLGSEFKGNLTVTEDHHNANGVLVSISKWRDDWFNTSGFFDRGL